MQNPLRKLFNHLSARRASWLFNKHRPKTMSWRAAIILSNPQDGKNLANSVREGRRTGDFPSFKVTDETAARLERLKNKDVSLIKELRSKDSGIGFYGKKQFLSP